ncbi:uncharacterized protein LOC117336340 [Pecten maximus]|uniref:uncharacterized protein LOC117336340 n=1 Tax=Pecten maximus TaxID=6579 RepID=UPI001458B6DD|nr:uncharacterized protein LOC117336340 [Pecten maximus]
MPKKGQPDSYWEGVMKQYAAGKFKFSTGKKPGSRKWKDTIRKIDECPRHLKMQTVDLLGRRILCKCGYHKKNVAEDLHFLEKRYWILHQFTYPNQLVKLCQEATHHHRHF